MFPENERLGLLLKCLILDKLDPGQSWGTYADILRHGYAAEYYRIKDMLYPELSEDKCKFVTDVLSMYDAMQRLYTDRPDKQPVPAELLFWGFDGNSESEYLGYADFVIKDERWEYVELGGMKDLNSHHPTLEIYERMLAKWREFGEPSHATKAQADAIVAERTHPSNR